MKNEYERAVLATYVSVIIGLLICLLKFAGFYLTDSRAILSDALESIINVFAASFAAYAVRLTRQGADKDHPYGKGRIEYFSAGFEGGLISLAGIVILYESIPQIFLGNTPQKLDQGIFLIVIGTVMNAVLGFYLVRAGKKYHSQALMADGHHVYSDVVTSLGMIIGLVVVYFTRIPWLDPVIASIMAVWILISGFKILRSSINRLMDRVNLQSLSQIAQSMEKNRTPEMIRPHKLRLRESGPSLLLDFHLIIPRYYTVKRMHDLETECARLISEDINRHLDLLLHYDPCIDDNCRFCQMKECNIRSQKCDIKHEWTSGYLQSDIEHPFEDTDEFSR
ncbi:MAG: cation diffusion facilitator family transporter [Spirochaetia bacterium]|nr:cation diffusion facilitator family transporter [Spirochaetia bacterium]